MVENRPAPATKPVRFEGMRVLSANVRGLTSIAVIRVLRKECLHSEGLSADGRHRAVIKLKETLLKALCES